MMVESIKRLLFPSSYVLSNHKIQILDEELDPIDCELIEDGLIELDVSKYNYIHLSHDNLIALLDAIEFNNTRRDD